MALRSLSGSVAASLLLASPASAQWTYISLHPLGAAQSRAIATTDTQQTGWAEYGGDQHAGIWSGPASFIDLNPVIATSSFGHATTGLQQAGFAIVGGVQVASLWTGTAASWTDINPLGATSSYVLAMSGLQKGGWAVFGGVRAPGVWNGITSTWQDLSPPDNTEGLVRDTNGTQQVGYSSGAALLLRAFLWDGTAASGVNLHPAALGGIASIAYATIGTMQAGSAAFPPTGLFNAGTWTGTAASWVNLNPPGASDSQAIAMTDSPAGPVQAGYATFAGFPRAGVWYGTAASWIDLHSVLPPALYSSSETRYIFSAGSTLYVAGFAYNYVLARDEAILWVSAPECSDGSDNDSDGRVDHPADPGCSAADDSSEKGVPISALGWLTCDDGVDNDGDGLVDYPADPGCREPLSFTENPPCNNWWDDDQDGYTDYPADPECATGWDTVEHVAGAQCGIGYELGLVMPLLWWLYERRRERARR